MMSSPYKSSSILLSKLLVLLIPASVVVYRLIYTSDSSVAVLVFRPVILAVSGILCFLLWYGARNTWVERQLVGVLIALCGVTLMTSLVAVDPKRALEEWVKLVIMCLIAVMLCRPLRHVPTAKVFGAGLVAVSAVIAGLILSLYLRYMGPVLPDYAATRIYKEVVFKAGIPLNPVAFECMFSYVLGMCFLRTTRFLLFVGAVLLVICSTLTGSRAPLAGFLVSGLLLLVFKALHDRRLIFRVAGWFAATVLVAGTAAALLLANPQEMSAATEGRWELWSTALHKFEERPLVGFGYMSELDDPSYIPGGYHSEYMTALAEQGIIGTVAVLALFWFTFRCSWKLAFHPEFQSPRGRWILFACLLLVVRASIETPGLFGSAQGPADFLAYMFLAMVVSQVSLTETRLVPAGVPMFSSSRLVEATR